MADLVYEPSHAGSLAGATRIGEASGASHLVVRVGLWLDGEGRVTRARHRASTCASLIAYAEVACELAEAGLPPSELGAGLLLEAVSGAHPRHRDRALLVAAALGRALVASPRPSEVSP